MNMLYRSSFCASSSYIVLIVTLLLSSSVTAQVPQNGWWNSKVDCKGKYYRYFDFNDKLRYFMPPVELNHIHVQPLIVAGDSTYLDETDNVEYAFNFKQGELNIHWKNKGESRIWYHCSQQNVHPPYLNKLRAYLINRSYIDLAEKEEDSIYSGDEFLFQQCMISFKNKNYKQAFDDCEFSWRANKNGMAAYYLGQIHQWGMLGKTDYKKAFEWYVKSSSTGYPDSFEWLAWAYSCGKGTSQNLVLARENYLTSANYGNINASNAVAKMLISGKGGKVDNPLAEKLLKASADANNLSGINALGVFYAKGLSGQVEPEKAFNLVKRAADKNHVRAKYNLGWFYILGIGTKVQKETGEKILKSLEKHNIVKEKLFLCASDIFQSTAQLAQCKR